MVHYSLIKQTYELIEYEYYPENNTDKKPGVITIDILADKVCVTTPAEEDFERYAEEFNERWWWYGNYAKLRILKDYNNGIVREAGMVAWY